MWQHSWIVLCACLCPLGKFCVQFLQLKQYLRLSVHPRIGQHMELAWGLRVVLELCACNLPLRSSWSTCRSFYQTINQTIRAGLRQVTAPAPSPSLPRKRICINYGFIITAICNFGHCWAFRLRPLLTSPPSGTCVCISSKGCPTWRW